MMFEWLERELAEIRTRRFHVIDGPASGGLQEAIAASSLPMPPSYKEFALKFGNAQLYRMHSYYLIGIFAAPREVLLPSGETLYHIGHYDENKAYFRESALKAGEESPVFELTAGGLRKTADGFAAWLEMRCRAARKGYKKREWKAVLNGPVPFTEDEKAIVEARKLLHWRVAGINEKGWIRFEIKNGSDRVLPYLSIGIRRKDGSVVGGAWLQVSDIKPGQTGFVEKECYRGLIPPEEVEAFALPDPEPEDRDRYWEFRISSSRTTRDGQLL